MKQMKMLNLERYTPELNSFGLPYVKGGSIDKPIKAITFKDRRRVGNLVHFYIYDYHFERIWNNPPRYLDFLKKFDAVIGPDFSMYNEMSPILQTYNLYRNLYMEQYWESEGINVIPNVSWSRDVPVEFAVSSLNPQVDTICITNHGVIDYETWAYRVDEVLLELFPKHIIIYGKEWDIDYNGKITYISGAYKPE